ncbi:hypothetical protein GCM10010305_34230 [Streptomyces termitum]|uniref:Circadian input-output histidine kinase CikA n=1 Tax=Streptomyces termitum TaxID=67368 RepID=A0A918W8X9_9ACTN|nr:hypothetical protein GCM10010305_34230 [Streptomyces termitum]
MRVQREGFIVKVRLGTSDEAVGVGFVVGDKQIVTCAHVVNVALGRSKPDRSRPPEDARVQVEFVLLGDAEGGPVRNFRISAWDPPASAGQEGRDVAGLTIVGGDELPSRAGPARLLDTQAGDTDVSAFGYPSRPARGVNGAWSSCVLRGAVGGGLIQLDAGDEAALRVQPGYSGSPVVVRDRWGDAVVGMLVIAAKDGAAADAYALPLARIAAAWPEVLGRTVLPPCPYRGLQAFTAADAEAGLFVGRDWEVQRLRDMVRIQPLAMVTGPSGVGKSSLVAAGLQPALEDEGWTVATFRPGSSPYESVARALLHLEHPDGAHTLEQLEARTASLRDEGFWKVAERLSVLTGRRLLLIGDQFEEVFGGGPDAQERLALLRHLFPPADTLPSAGVRLVCTLRADFLPDLLELPDVGSRFQDRQLNVSPLDEDALTTVIVEPARRAGVAFTPGLAEAIANEASKSAGSLPLLEFALTELWPLQRDRHLSFDSYHSVDGVSGALNRHAEKVYTFLAEQFSETRIRRVLLSMVRARGGSASAVRVTALRAHLGADWFIAQLLAQPEHRLVVIGPGGADTAEIAHEALIREWKRLAGWVDEDADFQQWLAVVEERASEADLLSATRVAEAQRWLGERHADIPEAVRRLIEHSSSEILQQQRTQEMLSQSQVLTEQLRERSSALEQRANELMRQNRDIELRHMETEEARQVLEERAEQLAVSMRYKSDFLANMSHELRTPLNSLLILARLLAANDEANLTPKQVEFAETIHGAGSDLLALINDILDLSRVEAGRMEVSPARIAVLQLADYVDTVFRPLAAEKGIDLVLRISPETPPTLHTDEQRILQVLRNLLSNAVKFTLSGTVTLAIQPVVEEVPGPARQRFRNAGALREDDETVIAFSVSDTGIGIAPEKLDGVFESFREDGTTNRRFGGTGLGLAISREIARLLGGEICAVSEPGRGSTFTFYLPPHALEPEPFDGGHPEVPAPLPGPAAPSPVRLPEERADALARSGGRHRSGPVFRGERVLIVDDDIRSVFAITTVLEDHRLNVLYAENGMEAIETLEAHTDVSLVLMDIAMPRMDGHTAIKAIRLMPQFTDLPIIVLTANAMKDDRRKALASGASAYIPKPVDPDRLIAMIQKWRRTT